MRDHEVLPHQVLDSCESTQILAKELVRQGYSHGHWISSRVQEKGRGRFGREWKSEAGNLFLSLILKVEDRSLWSWVPLTVSVAVADCVRKNFSQVPLQIKWPNDLWIHSMKIGGVLCESITQGSESYLIAGIGFNLAHAPRLLHVDQSSLLQGLKSVSVPSSAVMAQSTCLKDHTLSGDDLSLDLFRSNVVDSVLQFIDELNQKGHFQIQARYQQWSALPVGTRIAWGDSSQKRGRVIGLGKFSELRVQTEEGQIDSLFSEDVSVRPTEI